MKLKKKKVVQVVIIIYFGEFFKHLWQTRIFETYIEYYYCDH